MLEFGLKKIETDKESFERWKFENNNLIEAELTNNNEKTTLNTFTKYRPHHIYQTGVLTQFACDTCVEWNFMRTAIDSNTKHLQRCTTKECPQYTESMGNNCICDNCKSCKIIQSQSLVNMQLLDALCSVDGQKPEKYCVEGKCLHKACGAAIYKRLLLSGRFFNTTGCHTFNPNFNAKHEF